MTAPLDAALRVKALEAALTHANQGVVLAEPVAGDPERVRFLEANGAFLRQTGLAQDQLLGRGLELLAGPRTDEKKQARLLRRALTTACAIGGRFVFVRRGGAELHAELTIVPVARAGVVELLVLLFRDMTAEDELSARLAFSERLAAVGALAAGLGHEVNSPLAAVLMHLELMQEVLPRMVGDTERLAPAMAAQAARLDEHAEAARVRAEQVSAAVQSLQLLVTAQGDAGADPEAELALPGVIDAALRLVRPELRPRARVVRSYQDVPPVAGDAPRVQQAFVQLFLHIARVLPENAAFEREVRVSLAGTDAGAVLASVECRAPDIAPDALGQGLGPSIVQSIVASYGGRLSVTWGPGGARFDIELPGRPRGQRDRRRERRGRLLIVDDDAHLLSSLRLALDDEHDVDTAPGGGAALERLRADDAYDLILCDVQMEGLSGIDVLEMIRREAPAAARRFVFMTGGASTERARAYLAESETECLGKPFELDRLRHLVRQRVRDQRLLGEET